MRAEPRRTHRERVTPLRSLAEGLGERLGSIRARLTIVYSVVLFGLAALVLGVVYIAMSRQLAQEPVSEGFVTIERPIVTDDGQRIGREVLRTELENLERLVNEQRLSELRTYAFITLGFLFVASLGVGWFVAGRVLRPIHRITAVAHDIQATDLSRRIGLQGPKDELRDLADTFDEMLGRLEHAFEAQRRFIHEASHELRNPLAVMRTNLDVALADPDASPHELRRVAGVVVRATERMSRLVDDLLAYGRREVPAREREAVDLSSVVHDVAHELTATAAARDVRIRCIVGPAGRVRVTGDRTSLRQALVNLVDNAVRVAPAESEIRVSAGVAGSWAFLAVADDGPGIPAAEHDLVFERFWRHDRGDGHRGSGLGLTIVRQIAERHGGKVTLASDEGAGATFALWLPSL